MKSSILDTICSPQDVKELPFEQLDVLCTQIRERLIQTTAKTGDIWHPTWGRWS